MNTFTRTALTATGIIAAASAGVFGTLAYVAIDNDSDSAIVRDSHAIVRPVVVTETVEVPAAITSQDVAAFLSALPACATEDSADCYWDASAHGDGTSFVDIAGTVYYTELEYVEVPGETVKIEVPGPVEYVEVPAPVETWNGLPVGDVIVCAPGLTVADDVTPEGQVWAACM